MEIESMKSGAAASYQGSAAATSTKTPDTAVQPEASTQAGLSQTADKKPAVQNFFTEKDQEDKDPSQEKDAKQGICVNLQRKQACKRSPHHACSIHKRTV